MVDAGTLTVDVRVVFGSTVHASSAPQDLRVSVKPEDTVLDFKQKIAEAAGGQVTADDLLLSFGPTDRKMGRQYRGDPAVDEASLKLSDFSVLDWLRRFPHWSLRVSLLPAAPPPPGVAIQRAAATAEGKDPERAVQDARAKGDIPKISDLPAPWGPKPSPALTPEAASAAGYAPARYPESSRPAVDVSA